MKKVSTITENRVDTGSGVIVNDVSVGVQELPLVVTFKEGYTPSASQIERAKVLNGFAYQYPKKWKERKATLLKELDALADAPDPVENPDVRLEIGTKPKIAVK